MTSQEWWQRPGAVRAPGLPTPDQSQLIAANVAQMMAVLNEAMIPLHDAADGIRSQMRARGYSEEAAEAAAMIYLQNGINALWNGGGQ